MPLPNETFTDLGVAGPLNLTDVIPVKQPGNVSGITLGTTVGAIGTALATNNFISGTFTSAQVLATFPPTSNGGRTVNTTDLGLLTSDGTRWLVGPNPPIPLGAAILGYRKNVFSILPVLADVTMTRTGSSTRLYNGSGLSGTIPPSSAYSTASNGQLQLSFPAGGPTTSGSVMATQNAVSSQQLAGNLGTLPYLISGQGFYVEGAWTISSNVTDTWFSMFLQPQEHNTIQLDQKPSGDPPGYERWQEFDVNENGHGTDFGGQGRGDAINWFGPFAGALTFTAPPTGTSGTLAVSAMTNGSGQWQGDTSATWTIKFSDNQTHTATLTNGSSAVTWTGAITGSPTTAATVSYNRVTNSLSVVTPVDYTTEHTFGLAYDPVNDLVTWYQDDVAIGSKSFIVSDPIVKTWHYYIFFTCQTHGGFTGYNVNLRYFSAWTP